jgi:hypothetical protein
MDAVARHRYDSVDAASPVSTPGSSIDHSHADHDQASVHSRTPLSSAVDMSAYPPPPPMPEPKPSRVTYDPESRAGSTTDLRSRAARGSTWDLLSNIKNFEAEYEGYDSRKASEAHLAFAEGDLPNTKVKGIVSRPRTTTDSSMQFAKLYHYLINASVITRWILFIVPFLALLWIPGILSMTISKEATVRPLLFMLQGRVLTRR